MSLETELRWHCRERGVDYVGIADLAVARGFVDEQGGNLVTGLPRAVSLGIRLPVAIVDMLPRRDDRGVAIAYRHHAYDVINLRLDLLASELAGLLQREGHRALPVAASKRSDQDGIRGSFSHKLAAHLAGLGWIGRSCLLVTTDAGPRVRWVSVLTDAPLAPTGSTQDPRCGECRLCVEICPVRAFTGREFHEDEPREARYDARLCDEYFATLKAQDPETAVCGLCLYVCPFGRRAV